MKSTLWDGFWDGDLPTQSFMQIVALTSSPITSPQHRPVSAPAGLGGNQKNRDELNSFHARRMRTPVEGNHEATRCTIEYLHELRRGKGRTDLLLEIRLRKLEQENARLREKMLERNDLGRLERMADIQRRDLEVIASLNEAKERAERKAKSTQRRLRALKVREQRTHRENDGCPFD